jgi:hypothetical protein
VKLYLTEKDKKFFIKQKGGYQYNFENFRNIKPKVFITIEIQEEKGKRYKEIGMFLETIEKHNILKGLDGFVHYYYKEVLGDGE